MAGKELQVDEHLVVARTSAVDLLAHVAQLACEHELHLRVNILYAILDDKLAFLARVVDGLQLREQGLQLIAAKQSDALEHGDVGHGAQHVVLSEIKVHLAVAAHGEALNLLVYLKVLFPEFIRHNGL